MGHIILATLTGRTCWWLKNHCIIYFYYEHERKRCLVQVASRSWEPTDAYTQGHLKCRQLEERERVRGEHTGCMMTDLQCIKMSNNLVAFIWWLSSYLTKFWLQFDKYCSLEVSTASFCFLSTTLWRWGIFRRRNSFGKNMMSPARWTDGTLKENLC